MDLFCILKKKKRLLCKICALFIFATGWGILAHSQPISKISAKVSIKEKFADSTYTYSRGKISYNHNTKKTVITVTYPEKQEWTLSEKGIYKKADSLTLMRSHTSILSEFSIFRLAIEGTLNNYGLTYSDFTAVEVAYNDKMTVTTWHPPQEYSKAFSKILTSQSQGRLNGLVVYDTRGNIVSRQFFTEYRNFSRLTIPTQITFVNNTSTGPKYRIILFSELVVE